MAIVFATKNGNWSDPTVWNTGALPTTADDVRSNNFIVTVDGSYTVITVGNTANTTPAVAAGGQFQLTAGITFTCTQTGTTGILVNGSSTAVVFNGGPSSVCNVVSNCQSSANNGFCVDNTGTGTLNITAVDAAFTTLSQTGSRAVRNTGLGVLNLYGNVAVALNPGGTAVSNTSTGVLNIYGNITGTGGRAVANVANGTVNIYGNIAVGSGTSTPPIQPEASSVYNIQGSLQAVNNAACVSSTNTATVRLSGPFISAANGRQPVFVPFWTMIANSLSVPTYYEIRTSDLASTKTLYSLDSPILAQYPPATDVRAGVSYGGGGFTGTLQVPPANKVAFGVPVDAVTGTAILSSADLDAYYGPGVVERLQQCSTVASTGAQLAALLDGTGA